MTPSHHQGLSERPTHAHGSRGQDICARLSTMTSHSPHGQTDASSDVTDIRQRMANLWMSRRDEIRECCHKVSVPMTIGKLCHIQMNIYMRNDYKAKVTTWQSIENLLDLNLKLFDVFCDILQHLSNTYVVVLVCESHFLILQYIYLAPHRGWARYCNAHVCLFVCLCVCVFVCVFVRVFAKFQSVISQPFLNRSLWNLAYILRMGTPWQNFRSKVKVVGRRKVKNVIWPYLGNEWS